MVRVKLLPAPPNTGIRFQRMDLEGQPIIPALVQNVVNTPYCIVISHEQASVFAIEHLMAALMGMQITNVCIQLDGPEIPYLDSCSKDFVDILKQSTVKVQDEPRDVIPIKEKFTYRDPDTGSCFELYPSDHFSVKCMIACDKWPLENQYALLSDLEDFEKELAGARTCVFLEDILALRQQGKVQGLEASRAIMFSQKEVDFKDPGQLSTLPMQVRENVVTPSTFDKRKLNYVNEPARHKLLDFLGALSLLGKSIRGELVVYNPNHKSSIAFVQSLKQKVVVQASKAAPCCDLNKPPLLDAVQINRIMPHRYPFQLVDKVMDVGSNSIVGIKNVTYNEPYFQGHFPDFPIMPGVLQVEALAQTGGIMLLHQMQDPQDYATYFLSIDDCKFRYRVVPGDVLLLYCQLVSDIRFRVIQGKSVGIAKIKGQIFVSDRLVCQAVLLVQAEKNQG